MSERGGVTLQEETMWRGGVATALADDLRSRLLEVLVAPASPRKMTYDEFLAWANEDTLAEWVDGEVVMYSPASNRHQDLARFLTSVLGIYVETHSLGVIRPAPFQMKLEHGREPDAWERLVSTRRFSAGEKVCTTPRCCPTFGYGLSGCGRSRCRPWRTCC